jgi:hypothetical protein
MARDLDGLQEAAERFDMEDPFFDEDISEEVSEAELEEQRDLEIQALVTRAAEEAINWRAEELDDDLAENTNYYMGRPFGDEVKGRSRVVMTEVRDTVQAMLPSFMRIFFGPEDTVEFQPRSPEDEAQAKQATDYINYVVRQDNDGFMVIWDALKDALVRRLGIIKYWHEDRTEVEGYSYSGLDEQALVALQSDPTLEVEVIDALPLGDTVLYSAQVTRTSDMGSLRIDSVPPEEFIFTPDARSIKGTEMVGHVRHVPAAELVELGYDADVVDSYKGKTGSPAANAESLKSARRFDAQYRHEMSDERDESREEVLYGELYMHIDFEDDGTAPLYRIYTMGDAYEIVDYELCHEVPFALFCPDPEPHTIVGLSVADYVKDIQRIKSNIVRGALDSLTLALNPRTEIVEGEVNIGDVMNTEMGAVIRATKPGQMREVITPFVGKEALPMLAYMDETKENRTGISKAAAGLDADALQSATKAAVAATLTGAQQHIELMARIFAETGFKQLYKGLLKLATQHQDQERMIKLRNEWVPINPASWDATMDVTISVALGSGSTEERMQILQLVYQDQKEQVAQGSPLVGFGELRATAARLIELAGFPNAQEFYKPWGPEQEQQYQQQQQQQQEDPQVEALKASVEIERQRLALDQQEAVWKHERELRKLELDFAAKQFTAELQYQGKVDDMETRADVDAAREVIRSGAAEAQAKVQAEAQANAAAQSATAPSAGGGQPPQR